jgi:hypothetical protein
LRRLDAEATTTARQPAMTRLVLGSATARGNCRERHMRGTWAEVAGEPGMAGTCRRVAARAARTRDGLERDARPRPRAAPGPSRLRAARPDDPRRRLADPHHPGRRCQGRLLSEQSAAFDRTDHVGARNSLRLDQRQTRAASPRPAARGDWRRGRQAGVVGRARRCGRQLPATRGALQGPPRDRTRLEGLAGWADSLVSPCKSSQCGRRDSNPQGLSPTGS